MKEPRDAYKVLQVDPEADLEVIQAAYRRLAQKYHPDRVGADGDPAAAAVRMVEINAAWEQIGQPAARAGYDRDRAAKSAAVGAAAARSTSASAARPRPATNRGTSAGRGADPDAPFSGADATAAAASRRSGSFAGSIPSPNDAARSAGPPPGRPSGSILNFGRYSGWSLGEVSRIDPGYLEWLDRSPIGRAYRGELDLILRRLGMRVSEQVEATERHGLFRRR